jgi:hypothetical protein
MAVVGETLRIDHGDKVTERYVISISETNVRSESRWISGTPYVYSGSSPSKHTWDCTHAQWAKHIEAMKAKGAVLKHEVPNA